MHGATRRAGDLHTNARVQRRLGGFIVTDGIYSAALKIGRHDHELASLCVVLSGSYDESFGRRTRYAEPGTIIVHPAGEHHAETHGPVPAKLLTVEVEPACLRELRPVVRAFDEAWHRKDNRLASFAFRLRFESDRNDPISSLRAEEAIMEMLSSIDRMRVRDASRSPWLLRVRDRLEADPGDVPTMKQLSQLAGVHPVYLTRAFRKGFGCSIGGYLRRLRVGKAMLMLEAGASNLSAVAYETGFSDQSHMTRLIRAQTGLPPGAWRRRSQGIL